MKTTRPSTAATIVGMVDTFQETRAPYRVEERVSASGSRYPVKVYDAKRRARWVVVLSNGKRVSQEGVLRLRAPEAWDRVRRMPAKAREQAVASAVWAAITPDERLAMIHSANLAEYAEGRSLNDAMETLQSDLAAGGNILAHVDASWRMRMIDVYADLTIGGPIYSREWYTMTWASLRRYAALTSGLADPGDTDPRTMPFTYAHHFDTRLAGWLGSLWTLAQNARPDHARDVLSIVTARLGGDVSPSELLPFPDSPRERKAAQSARDARLARIAPGDRGVSSFLYGRRGFESDGVLGVVNRAWTILSYENAWTHWKFQQPRPYDDE